ncbi:hypothetical protein ACFLVN_01440, partial [Chloroflexota bacterium]
MKRILFMILTLAIITSLTLPSKCWAWTPPSYWSPTTVDGDISEWDLTNDFFANMYRAGKDTKPLESKAYLRYDCEPDTLYVLVLTETGIPALAKGWESSAWAAIGKVSNKVYTGMSGNDGIPPDFAWVGLSADGLTAQGYEASFQLDNGTWTIMIHVEVFDSEASQTSASTGSPKTGLGFTIICLGEHPLAIHVNKYVSLDNQASWIEATIPPGPTVVEGTNLYFKYVVSNSVNIPLYNITLTDSVYDLSGISPSLPPELAPENEPGDSYVGIIGPITAAGEGLHTNRATTSGYNAGGTPTEDSEEQDLYYTVIPVQADPSITVQKYVSADDLTYLDANDAPGLEVELGAPVYFKFVVTNSGNVPLGDITLTDSVYNLSGINPPLPSPFTLDQGISYTGVIGPIYESAGEHANTATATGHYNSTECSDTDSANFWVNVPTIQVAHLKLTKNSTLNMSEVEPNDVANIGDKIDYIITVINDGNVPLTGVTVVDSLLGALSCTLIQPATLDPGESMVCTGSYTLDQDDIDTGYVDNITTADSLETDAIYASNTQDISQNLYLSLAKDSTLDMTVVPPDGRTDAGDKINYTLVATNDGNVTLSGVSVTDAMVGTLTAVWPDPSNPGRLLIGQSAIFTGSYTLTQADVDAGYVDNTAIADSDQTEPVQATNTQDILQILHMSITKSGTVDMAVVAPNDEANEGDRIDYVITI